MSYYREEYSNQDYDDDDQDYDAGRRGYQQNTYEERSYQRDDHEERSYQRDDYEDDRYVQRDVSGGGGNNFVDREELIRRGLIAGQEDNYNGGARRGYQQSQGFDDRAERSFANQPRGFAEAPPPGPPPGAMQAPRKKSLLIGINYVGSQHALQGCHQDVNNMREFLTAMGYPSDSRSQVVMRDDGNTDPRGPMFPNGHNLLAAMQWLVSEPNTVNFLHYSGHGGQVPSEGYGSSGFSDTIVPVDFERGGQIPSNILHRTLVSSLPANSTLFIVLDCCHSGSALELPYVFRADENGNVNMMDNVKTGMLLMGEASHLIQGGFTIDKVGEAKQLLAGATDFFRGLTHKPAETDQYGLGESKTADTYRNEGMRNVWMYSGCRDDQTSADASIQGSHVGAMSWAFLESMKRYGTGQSYLQVLQNTRQILADKYTQIPQLSVGYEQDLNYQLRI
ncbi:hypothetical protein AMS68_007414 [Peltaster fructicola]|uniref:Peptidase C14 caspase domain-containing protein n=1 Tax=Peltaster fructicola TaxID=286661 RepID=A0A6H0Y4E1_9PEZI|nr:hypothetical protein AMS68_007414 [Peltaster fructicola]